MTKRALAFGLALLIQLGLLAAVPYEKYSPRFFGQTVLLKIAPYDPYNLFSGYYAQITFDISQPPELSRDPSAMGPIYTVIRPGPDGVWTAIASSSTWPAEIPQDALVIRGELYGGRVEYGIEQYFIPETRRDELTQALIEHREQARAEVRVDHAGRSALIHLHVAGTKY